MKVHLRERISKKTGRVTLYLEIYKGHKKNVNGSIEHIRDYEYLDYYLYLNPKSGVEKQHNKDYHVECSLRNNSTKRLIKRYLLITC